MPWFYRVIYGEPKLSEVEVEARGYLDAIRVADAKGHRPSRCRKARAEYVKFVPKENEQTRTSKRPQTSAEIGDIDSTESGS